MTPLTKEEIVWLQAYIASITSKMCPSPETIAYSCLKHFKETFPSPTTEDKPAVNSVKGVYVTREMLAEAFYETRKVTNPFSHRYSEELIENMAKYLGLKP